MRKAKQTDTLYCRVVAILLQLSVSHSSGTFLQSVQYSLAIRPGKALSRQLLDGLLYFFLIITLKAECLRYWSFLWTHRCEVEAPIANFQEPTRYCCVSPWPWQGPTRYVLLVSHSSPMYTPIGVVLRHSKICRKDQETKRGKEQRMQSLSIFCVFIFLEMNFYSCSPTGQLHRLQWGVHWQQC